jgi:phosphogluconate dehydratase
VDPERGVLDVRDAEVVAGREPTGSAPEDWSGTGRELFAAFRATVGPADAGASVFPSYVARVPEVSVV